MFAFPISARRRPQTSQCFRLELRTALALLCTWAFMAVPLGAFAATNVFSVVNSGFSAYLINGAANPNLTLVRGFTYDFQINASGHPFLIKTLQGIGAGNAYTNGVSGNGAQVGTITFSVPTNAPALLFYNCQFHAPMTGQLNIQDPPVVRIGGMAVETNRIVLTSSGTTALNVYVKTRYDLTTDTWLSEAVLSNSYSAGTNTTEINLPAEPVRFFRVLQRVP